MADNYENFDTGFISWHDNFALYTPKIFRKKYDNPNKSISSST